MYLEEYERWMAADLEDADLNPELRAIEGDETEIKERLQLPLSLEQPDYEACWGQEQTV